MYATPPLDSIRYAELFAAAPPLVAWERGLVDSSDEVAAFMYHGGLKSPLAGIGDQEGPDLRPDKKYWSYVKAEMRVFLCDDDPRYEELWSEIRGLKNGSGTAIVASIAAHFAFTLGVAATLLTGFVAVVLYAFLKIGKEAYCRLGEKVDANRPGKRKRPPRR